MNEATVDSSARRTTLEPVSPRMQNSLALIGTTLSVSQKDTLPSLSNHHGTSPTTNNSTSLPLLRPVTPPSTGKLLDSILQTSLDRSNHKRKTSLNMVSSSGDSPLHGSSHSEINQGGSSPTAKGSDEHTEIHQ